MSAGGLAPRGDRASAYLMLIGTGPVYIRDRPVYGYEWSYGTFSTRLSMLYADI